MRLLLFLILIPSIVCSQRIKRPSWPTDNISFETAKFKTVDAKTNEYGPESYKTSKIFISDGTINSLNFIIDIPDKFYLKDADNFSMKYAQDEENNDYITYTLIKDDLMCAITFYFNEVSDKPTSILVTVIENIKAKVKKQNNYLLTELK